MTKLYFARPALMKKFYLNPEFDQLPESVRQELQIMCVLYTVDVGGILMLVFDADGNLELKVDHEENDFAFDEIGSVLKIKELQQTKRELFESLETFLKYFIWEWSTTGNFRQLNSGGHRRHPERFLFRVPLCGDKMDNDFKCAGGRYRWSFSGM